jgi:hypothetical protein
MKTVVLGDSVRHHADVGLPHGIGSDILRGRQFSRGEATAHRSDLDQRNKRVHYRRLPK